MHEGVKTGAAPALLGSGLDLRGRCQQLLSAYWWRRFILLAIVLSCVEPAVEGPAAGEQLGRDIRLVLWVFEIGVTVIFTVEAVIQFVGVGRHKYLRSPMLLLELLVVVSSWLLYVLDAEAASVVKLLRVLRPMQALRRLPAMEVVLSALASAITDLSTVGLVAAFFFLCAGVLALQVFGGSASMACQVLSNASGDASHATVPAGNGAQAGFLFEPYYNGCAVEGAMGQSCADVATALETVIVRAAARAASGTLLNESVAQPFCGAPALPSPPGSASTARLQVAAQYGASLAAAAAAAAARNASPESAHATPVVAPVVAPALQCADSGVYRDTYNFGGIAWSAVNIFTSITGVGWTEIMYRVQDTRGWWAVLPCTLYTVFGLFVLVNMLVAVLDEAYNAALGRLADERKRVVRRLHADADTDASARSSGRSSGRSSERASARGPSVSAELADSADSVGPTWRRLVGRCAARLGVRPLSKSAYRQRAPRRRLVESTPFRAATMCVVLANIAVIALYTPYLSPTEEELLRVGNVIFAALYTVEMACKVRARDAPRYPRKHRRSRLRQPAPSRAIAMPTKLLRGSICGDGGRRPPCVPARIAWPPYVPACTPRPPSARCHLPSSLASSLPWLSSGWHAPPPPLCPPIRPRRAA